MKITHRPEIDYLSIDFSDEIEASSVFEKGLILRFDKHKHVIGIDITNSSKLFQNSGSTDLTLKEACTLLGVSEATLRRKIKSGKLPYTKPNQKDFRLKLVDVLQLKKAS